MKKLIFAVLTFFAVSAVFAQVSTNPADDFYDMVERWEIMGIISEQPPLRPYPLQTIEKILTEVIEGEDEEASETAQEYYEYIFKKSFKLAAGGQAAFKISGDDKTKQIIAFGGVDGDYSFPKYASIGYKINALFTNNDSLNSVPQYTAQRYYFHDPVKLKKLKGFLDMDASFAVGNDRLYAQFGVNNCSFGPLYSENAIISPDAKHTANFSFVYNAGRFSYTQALLGLSASNCKGGAGDLFSKKFLTLHSLNFELFKWLDFSFYESTIYGDRFEPAYLVPIPYIITQGLSGFDDNTFMGFSFTVRPVPGFAWTNEFYVDDFELSQVLKLNFDTKLRGTFQSVFKFSPADISWIDMLKLRYTLVTPYMYTHKQNLIDPATGNWRMGTLSVINYQEYTTAGEALGLSLPPNTEQFALSLSFRPVRKLKITARGAFTRHCNVNESLTIEEAVSYLNSPGDYFVTDGGIHNHQHYLSDGDPANGGTGSNTYLATAWDYFLFMTQPTKMKTIQAGFDLDYTITATRLGSLSLDFGYTFEHIINAGVDREIFKGYGTYDSNGNYVCPNKTAADVEKALDEWRAALFDVTNHYIRIGLKYTW